MKHTKYNEYKEDVLQEMKELAKLGYDMKDAIKFVESGKANGFIQESFFSGTEIKVVSDHIWQWNALAD
tara:strand:- start:182 stop:388 length:207 start_codon:yes stop_codon:yes gene_type:complete